MLKKWPKNEEISLKYEETYDSEEKNWGRPEYTKKPYKILIHWKHLKILYMPKNTKRTKNMLKH